jgi:hypothetical protein
VGPGGALHLNRPEPEHCLRDTRALTRLIHAQAILAARSSHFRAMFSSGMRESHSDGSPIDYGDQWSGVAFTALLEFLYTGTVQLVSALCPSSRGLLASPCDLNLQLWLLPLQHSLAGPAVAEETMSLAQYTGVDGLKALCEAALMHAVDPSTVCTLISTAHRCQVS